MLRRTYAFIVSEWKILLGIVIGLAAFSFMIERKIIPESSAFSLFIDVWISFGVIRSIVFNVGMFQKGAGTIPREFPRFSYLLKYAFVIFSALLVSFLIFYMTPWWRYLGSNAMFLMTFALIALPVFAIVYTFLGTWLVADVYGEEKGFGDALVRGSERFFPNFAKYLLLFLCQIILFGVVVIFLPKLIPQSLFPLEGKLGWLPDAVFYIFVSTIRVLGNIAWAVLAAMMYMFHLNLHRGREAEPAESATVV